MRRTATSIKADVSHAQETSKYPGDGGGTLFTEPVLVVCQKAKLVEVVNEYAIYDEVGNQIGGVREVAQSRARRLLRVVNLLDAFLAHTLEVVDMSGQAVLVLTRHAGPKGRIVVEDGAGREIGRVIQQNWFGKKRFDLEAGGRTVGSVDADNQQGSQLTIRDDRDDEVGRIRLVVRLASVVTTADTYVVRIHHPLEEPLLSLVVAAAVCVDTALHQFEPPIG